MIKSTFKERNNRLLLYAVLIILFGSLSYQSKAGEQKPPRVDTKNEKLVQRVAPGEFLPLSVKLANFGDGKKIDVIIYYQIFDSTNTLVLTETETVAVETTASFVQNVKIPDTLAPGIYTASSNIIYEGQEVPAVSSFSFRVEKKIAGIFLSDFILYMVITLVIALAFAVISRLLIKRKASRFFPHDYSHIPEGQRAFYEMTNDLIMHMRSHVGDKALQIAKKIEGLEISENGKIKKMTKDPAEIVALLFLHYQKEIGKKPRIPFRKGGIKKQSDMQSVDRHIKIIEKYF